MLEYNIVTKSDIGSLTSSGAVPLTIQYVEKSFHAHKKDNYYTIGCVNDVRQLQYRSVCQ